jgi:hypothetical protein
VTAQPERRQRSTGLTDPDKWGTPGPVTPSPPPPALDDDERSGQGIYTVRFGIRLRSARVGHAAPGGKELSVEDDGGRPP